MVEFCGDLSLYGGMWKIWMERNSKIFKNKNRIVDEIVQSIVWNVLEWASRKVELEEVSLEAFNRSWATNLKGRWHANVVYKIRWDSLIWKE